MLIFAAILALTSSAGVHWEGNFHEGPGNDVEIHRTHYNQLRVNVSGMSRSGCIAEIEFLAPMPKLPELYLLPAQRQPLLDQDPSDHCSLSLDLVGNILIVHEINDCSKDHGPACGFEGRFHRVS
jgi:hypothetical protein